jgi:hypothetical protein
MKSNKLLIAVIFLSFGFSAALYQNVKQRIRTKIDAVSKSIDDYNDLFDNRLDELKQTQEHLDEKLSSLKTSSYSDEDLRKIQYMSLWNQYLIGRPLPESEYGVYNERQLQIEHDKNVILSELNKYGSWEKWYDLLADFRKEVAHVRNDNPYVKRKDLNYCHFMQTATGHFIHEEQLDLLLHKYSDEANVVVNGLVAFKDSLKARGIDFIYIPVPSVPEIHPEQIVKDHPSNLITSPFSRQLIYELLNHDIEVVDLYWPYINAKNDEEDVYLLKNTHWSNYGIRLAADIVSGRLSRYPFVRKSELKEAQYKTRMTKNSDFGKAIRQLPDDVKNEFGRDDFNIMKVDMKDGSPYESVENSPVLVIGDSFAYYFSVNFLSGGSSGGFAEHLAYRINMPVSLIATSGMMLSEVMRLEADGAFKGRKLVIFIQAARSLQLGSDAWKINK